MMRTEGRERRRPRGAVLRPLGLLIAAVATGFGMWRALVNDGRAIAEQLSRGERTAFSHRASH